MKYDFGGYATRNNLKCTDGRTILQNAFIDNNGGTVPLVWQHRRDDPENVLGHALLENRDDGVYAYCTFNGSKRAQHAKMLIEHGDVNSLSIYATGLSQNAGNVTHGTIREVSLVLAGANPGAYIDDIQIEHSDGSYSASGEAVIYGPDTVLEHAAKTEDPEDNGKMLEKKPVKEDRDDNQNGNKKATEIFNSFTEEQKNFIYALIATIIAEDKNESSGGSAEQSVEGGDDDMKKNVFEGKEESNPTYTITHADEESIFAEAKRCGSLKAAVEAFASAHQDLEHGIDNLDILFPEAKAATAQPEMLSRRMEWVSKVWNGFKKSPFSRIKNVYADITMDEARAKGYIKGHKKVEEQFALLKRVTQPTTIYKKQKFDRDDIIDITDFDLVAWVKTEMRMMLDEELSRAALIGDGRSITDDDKIDENCIRPIYHEEDMYAIKVPVSIAPGADTTERSNAITDAAVRAREEYRGSGEPTFFTTTKTLNDLMLAKDKNGRRIYNTQAELAAAMRVREIVEVPVMENLSRTVDGKEHLLIGIIVNLTDYTIGADRGGAVTMFDDFDIDYNKYTYLIETRLSGSLNKPYSAIILEEVTENTPIVLTVVPDEPGDTQKGKKIRELQYDIQLGSDFVAGKLRYVNDYTEFSVTEDLQSGHYVALKATATGSDEITVQILGGKDDPKKLDGNGIVVARITDPSKQKIRFVAKKDSKVVASKTLSLTNLQLM